MSVKNNIRNLQEELSPFSCKLIAISKTQPAEKIMEAYHEGQRRFGENKVQEMCNKYEQLPKDIEWHLVGHLQRNKVKYIASFVSLIHAVDSLKLLEEINKQAVKHNRVINCLLQVHIAKEETKFGFSEDELLSLISQPEPGELKNIQVIGLMGMATFTDDLAQVKTEFKNLKTLFDKINELNQHHNISMKELSMGMSGDYKIALEEGSTMVRIGTTIFGERNYQT